MDKEKLTAVHAKIVLATQDLLTNLGDELCAAVRDDLNQGRDAIPLETMIGACAMPMLTAVADVVKRNGVNVTTKDLERAFMEGTARAAAAVSHGITLEMLPVDLTRTAEEARAD